MLLVVVVVVPKDSLFLFPFTANVPVSWSHGMNGFATVG